MRFVYFLQFLVYIKFAKLQFCETDQSEECGNNKGPNSRWSKEWSEYESLIKNAAETYAECTHTSSGCSNCYDETIKKDLSPFADGISKETLDSAKTISRITKYQIIDGQLFRSENCMFPFRCSGIEHFLLELVKDLPNTEFYLNTRDWPMAGRHFGSAVPVFSFSKTKDYWDIMFPAWTFWEGGPALGIYPNGLGRWDEYRKTLSSAAAENPWSSKESKVFFRGSRTSAERDPLVLISRKNEKLVDAKYTKNQAWKSSKDTLGEEPAEEVKLEEHCRFKYLFNYRGVAASFRFKHLFLCRSLVFHVGDEWLEFFYPSLVPWFHYIPVSSTADQHLIQSIVNFAIHHDGIMREISENGANFIENHLTLNDISCYWRTLLLEYTKLLTFSISRDQTLIRID